MTQEDIARARAGDPAATEALVRALRPRLERMALYYARCCREDADDLEQEAWAGLFEALPCVDLQIGSAEHYLLQRARWRLLDALKRAYVRRCRWLDEEDAVCERAADGLAGALFAVDVAAFAELLRPTQRAVLACLLSGLTWRQAGTLLGCSSANIAYHVRQIRTRYASWRGENPPPDLYHAEEVARYRG